MSKYEGYKHYEGLVWRIYNHNLFGVLPDDEKEVVQKVYYLRARGLMSEVQLSELDEDGNPTKEVVKVGDEDECREYWDALADERVDPGMLCFTGFSIG